MSISGQMDRQKYADRERVCRRGRNALAMARHAYEAIGQNATISGRQLIVQTGTDRAVWQLVDVTDPDRTNDPEP